MTIHTDNKETLQNALKRIEELEGQVTRAFEVLEGKRKRIEELEQKLEQTEKDLTDYQFNYPKIKDLEKENAELKLELEALSGDIPWNELKDVSEVAKEILKKVVGSFYYLCEINNFSTSYECLAEAEQFLKDCDIDNAIQQANKGLDFDKIADEMEQDLKDSEVEK